eukprot:6658819-Alexandrium_andersonii.AAC.1
MQTCGGRGKSASSKLANDCECPLTSRPLRRDSRNSAPQRWRCRRRAPPEQQRPNQSTAARCAPSR